jgi:hypothetical protein
LVEFRAGRIVKDGTTAKPDTRKGLVRVLRVRLRADCGQKGSSQLVCSDGNTD